MQAHAEEIPTFCTRVLDAVGERGPVTSRPIRQVRSPSKGASQACVVWLVADPDDPASGSHPRGRNVDAPGTGDANVSRARAVSRACSFRTSNVSLHRLLDRRVVLRCLCAIEHAVVPQYLEHAEVFGRRIGKKLPAEGNAVV